MRTFRVSDVEVSRQLLEVLPTEQRAAQWFADPVDYERPRASDPSPTTIEACGINQDRLVGSDIEHVNPLLAALHTAFSSHYPLALSPDDVWLCLAQGFAKHVQGSAEALRTQFVRHEGKITLEVRRDDFVRGDPGNDWKGCFAEWSDAIAAHIGKKRDLVVAGFSTTGPIERAASELVLMNAMESYFDVRCATLCGIPEITLLGSVDDWRAIRQRAETFAEFDLGDWLKALLPVLDQFVAAADGLADPAFWRSMYKAYEVSGGPFVTGWINVLFPYLDNALPDQDRPYKPRTVRNQEAYMWWQHIDPGGTHGQKRARGRTWTSEPHGPCLDGFPRGLTQVPLTWHYRGEPLSMTLFGGFVGISQDPETRTVRPAIGWAVSSAAR